MPERRCEGDDNWHQLDPPAGAFESLAVGDGYVCALRAANGANVCWGVVTR